MNRKTLFTFLLVSLTLSTLQACAPVLFAGGATAIGMAAQDQGLDGALDDQSLKFEIKTDLIGYSVDLYNRIDINVLEGNVLLTGFVPSKEDEMHILDVLKKVSGIRHIFNELEIGEEEGIGDSMSDAWISGKIRTELFLTSELKSSNFLVHTTMGIVYLMGVAQDQKELDEVLEIIQSTSGVKKVVNMTRFKDDPLPERKIVKKKHTDAGLEKIKNTPVETRALPAPTTATPL